MGYRVEHCSWGNGWCSTKTGGVSYSTPGVGAVGGRHIEYWYTAYYTWCPCCRGGAGGSIKAGGVSVSTPSVQCCGGGGGVGYRV